MSASFNSLQTGKWILTETEEKEGETAGDMFQFPSNGKVDPNDGDRGQCGCTGERFNSLQTGKWILTSHYIYFSLYRVEFQFPSNGKVDPNEYSGSTCEERRKVSIPFKRESGS